MITYPIPMVPGPVKVPEAVLAAMAVDYGSADLENEFLNLYNQTEVLLQTIFSTRNRILIQTGEGMLVLWGALKSTLMPGDRVLALGTGVFGYGIGEMAALVGAEVRTYGLPYDQTLNNWEAIEREILEFKPNMITVVHCETPSGTLNPLLEVGKLKAKHNVPLLYVDAVASAGGTTLLTDKWQIDLCLGGSQKVLATPPMVAFLSVSPAAWQIASEVNYAGYDALLPFREAQANFYFPYTPNWHGVAALHKAAELLLQEGLENVFTRHAAVSAYCRQRVISAGLKIFPAPQAIPSPTVTAVLVPESIPWHELDRGFRQRGLVVGGSYGPLAGKVFRIGHMGTQADMDLVRQAMDVIEEVVRQ